MKTTLQVSEDLLTEFQSVVSKRFGKLKGSQSEALVEAMKLWLSYVGEARCVRTFGGGVDMIVELKDFPEIVRKLLENGGFRKSDVTAVTLFYRFTEDDVANVCSNIVGFLGGEEAASGSMEEFTRGSGVSFSWRLTNGRRTVLNCFPDSISVGERFEEPIFKDLKLHTRQPTLSAHSGEIG